MRLLPADLARKIEDRGRDLVILVVRLGALGDILRTLPAVRLIRESVPDAGISWVCDDRWGSLLDDHPDIDAIVRFPRAALRKLRRTPVGWASLPSEILRLRRELRSLHADIALDFHGNLRSGVVGLLSGAPVRLGYSGHQQKEGNRFFTTQRVDGGPRRTSRLERNLALVRALGLRDGPLPDGGLRPTVSSVRAARDLVARVAGRGAPYAILSPGASRKQIYKKPPAPLLAAAARELADRNVAPLVAYGPGEDMDAARVVQAADGAAHLLPPTDLDMLAALLRRARLFCGGDSGPLHLACAVGCPVVGLYGPTDPEVNVPWGVPYRVVSPPGRIYTGIKREDRRAGAFEGITAEAVGRAVAEVLTVIEREGRRSRRAL